MTQPTGLKDILADGAQLEALADGFRFIEGPVWMGSRLIFSDIPASELRTWSPADGVGLFRAPAHQANGNTLDRQGRLITCQHQSRTVTRTEHDGTVTVLAEMYDGKRLNSPNDVIVKSDGTIWFTDPTYGLGKAPQEQAQRWVFRMNADGSNLTPLVADAVQPNGLCLAPDEKKLYVVDSGSKPSVVRVYDVIDNAPIDGRIFCTIDQGVADGIRCDTDGRLYAACGDGVQVFATDGQRLGRILVPQVVTNCCFGDEDFQSLYMTGTKALYRIRLKTTGAGVSPRRR